MTLDTINNPTHRRMANAVAWVISAIPTGCGVLLVAFLIWRMWR